MKKNKIVVLNRLTNKELADIDVFENLVGDKYSQFSILYEIISGNNFIYYIDDITCKIDKKEVSFKIKLNKKFGKKLQDIYDENVKNISGSSTIVSCDKKDDKEIVISVGFIE